MKENLNIVMQGGDKSKLVGKSQLKEILETPGESAKFQTPQINNVFDLDSDFQVASAGVKGFTLGNEKEGEALRQQQNPESTEKKKKSSLMGGMASFFSSGKKNSPEKDKNSSGLFASSKARDIVHETKEKKQIQALENNKDLDDVDL